MKYIAITITQWNPLPVLNYPYKRDSNIVFTNMKSIAITITQWNSLPVLKYPHKWDSNIVSSTMKSIAITITQWIHYQYLSSDTSQNQTLYVPTCL